MGSIALFGAAVLATVALITGRVRPAVERPLQFAAIGAVGLSVLHVAWLLIAEDTSYTLVVDHTRPGLSVVRRVMGLWGGSAGSLLLFTLVVGGALVAAPKVDRLRAVPSVVICALAWTSALVASPFERLTNPAIAGSGLSPILEHWAMIIHPPLLYAGLGLALVPAIVAPEHARRWSAMAASILTLALALGGGWAYVELGWGGWYAWDPVENAALIPWLLLVAGLHVRPTHTVARWTALLVWPTVFAGTAMTRTSLRTSVHSFANSDGLGWGLWPLAAIVTIGAFAYGFATRAKMMQTFPDKRRLMPVVLIGFAAVVVALGTFRPFIPGEATDGTFYARFLYPVVILGLLGIGIAPRYKPKETGVRPRALELVRIIGLQALIGLVAGLALGVLAGWTSWWQLIYAAALGVAVSTTLGAGVRPFHRTLAHLGMICVLAGALGGTASISQTFPLEEGESIEIQGYSITNRGVELVDNPAPTITANVVVNSVELRPALTVYAERRLRLPEVATYRRLHEDVQLILRSADDDGSVLLTANIEPLTQFVWLGAALIASGLTIAAAARRSTRRPHDQQLSGV
jgi:cytochrome c-type biogenesis protein CcmF